MSVRVFVCEWKCVRENVGEVIVKSLRERERERERERDSFGLLSEPWVCGHRTAATELRHSIAAAYLTIRRT